MKMFLLLTLGAVFSFTSLAGQTDADSVTIRGRVTDYQGNPLDSVSVFWQRPDFSVVAEVLTGADGYYKARIPNGRYYAVGALNMSEYIVTGSRLPEKDLRLEFWAWNFIADRDTTFDMRYHRMEAYGINVFRVQGATPGYTIYVRPMSLTRTLAWRKEPTPHSPLAPEPDRLDVKVSINGEVVPVRMKQKIKEYFEPGQTGDAYLLWVELPKKKNAVPYDIFRVVLTDLDNGDKGEGVYFLEKKEFVY